MRDLYSKTNAPYLIAGAFATLVLLASGTLAVAPYVAFLSPIVAFNVALPVALSLSVLPALVLILSCKMISNNKKIEVEKNKFAEKEQELENKITLEKEAEDKQVKELTREKQGLESEVKKLNGEKEQLEADNKNALDRLQQEKAALEQKIKGLESKVRELNEKVNRLKGQQEQQLDQKTRELAAKTQELKAANKQMEVLTQEKQELTHLKQRLDNAKKELCDKNIRTGELESELKKLTGEIAQEKKAKEAASKEVEELNNQLNRLTQEKQSLESEVERLNEEMEWLEDPQEELYDESKGKGGDENKNEELEKKVTKEIENLKASFNITSKNVDLHKQNEKHSSENSNIGKALKALFDKSLKAEEKFKESINKCEETLNTLEQDLSQGNTVANLLEMVKDLISEHVSEFEKITKNEFDNGLLSPNHMSTPKIKISTKDRKKSPRKSPKKEDEDENKESSEQLNHENPNTSTGSPNLSLFRDATNNSYHTLTM